MFVTFICCIRWQGLSHRWKQDYQDSNDSDSFVSEAVIYYNYHLENYQAFDNNEFPYMYVIWV